MEREYKWQEAYRAAALESDNDALKNKIEAARMAIDRRLGELSIGDNHAEERRAIGESLLALRVLWIERIGEG